MVDSKLEVELKDGSGVAEGEGEGDADGDGDGVGLGDGDGIISGVAEGSTNSIVLVDEGLGNGEEEVRRGSGLGLTSVEEEGDGDKDGDTCPPKFSSENLGVGDGVNTGMVSPRFPHSPLTFSHSPFASQVQ